MRCAPPSAAAAWWPAHVHEGALHPAPVAPSPRDPAPRPRCHRPISLLPRLRRHRPPHARADRDRARFPAPSPRGQSGSGSGSTSMWLFWRARDRFSLEELRYLTDQLQKVHAVNEANEGFVIEALRSIAELMIYGDQHDPSLFEYFMEKEIMGEFARFLMISKLSRGVSLQLLQTMGIMIQNLRDEHSVHYILSNEHIDFFITYPFDFRVDEMLSYYISFLRAISGKLNKDTVSLLAKTENDEVTSFPLYVEALKFAFHQDSMIRVAVRALTLNVYHVGDESVNRFVSRMPLSDYFSDMVQHFQEQCIGLDKLVARSSRITDSSPLMSAVEDAIVQIEDTLYYFSDVMSSGIPDLERLITDNILQALVFHLLLPSLQRQSTDLDVGVTTSMYLLCCILHILKNKDMTSTIAAALFHQHDCPDDRKQGTPPDGYTSEHDDCKSENHCTTASPVELSNADEPNSVSSVSWKRLPNLSPPSDCCQGNTPWEHLLSYITEGDDSQTLGALCIFVTLLKAKELDESMLDALGILPQREQHKKLLLQALVGEDLAERQLFSSSGALTDDSIPSDFDIYIRKLQDKYGLQCQCPGQMTSKAHRYQVLDVLADLFCKSKVSADVRLVGGWLFWQLLPHGEEEFTAFHLRRLKDSCKDCSSKISVESGGCWCDMLLPTAKEAWRNCKNEIEASSVAMAEGVYEIVKHCILASCSITKDGEDCQEESPLKNLGSPLCISKDIAETSMGEEKINTSRMEEYSHSYTEPLMLTLSSYKLQLLTILNNCYKLQQFNMLNTLGSTFVKLT